jgi:hypothetical protein
VPLLFTENLGQVTDDKGRIRPDILFTAHNDSAKVYLTATDIQYQFTKTSYPKGYFDMNTGILLDGSTDSYNNFYVGASLYHINQPKESFLGDQYFKLSRRYTFQAGGKLRTNQYNYFHFSANYSKQGKATNTSVGGAFALKVYPSEVDPTNLIWVPGIVLVMPFSLTSVSSLVTSNSALPMM